MAVTEARDPASRFIMDVQQLPAAAARGAVNGIIRYAPEDFVVREILPFEPCGTGEHLYLHVTKTGLTTQEVQTRLASWYRVKPASVGYAGLKDKWAVTEQWFSVHLPGDAGSGSPHPDLGDAVEVKFAARHEKKLRTGWLRENEFQLRVRDLRDPHGELASRLSVIERRGIPNYFGEQRFGRGGKNVEHGLRDLAARRLSRFKKAMYLSSIRAFLFNEVLALRVQQGNWDRVIDGDVMTFDDGASLFTADADTCRDARFSSLRIHPTGPLPGVGESMAGGGCLALENEVVGRYPELLACLTRLGVNRARRSLRARVRNLSWRLNSDELSLNFSLPKGCYATAFLRELLNYTEAAAALALAPDSDFDQ